MFSLKMYTILISMITFLLFKNTYAEPDISDCLDDLKEGFSDNVIDSNDSKQCAVYAMNNLIPEFLQGDGKRMALSYYDILKQNILPGGMKTVTDFCNEHQPAQQCIAKLRLSGITTGMTTSQICNYVFQNKNKHDFDDEQVHSILLGIIAHIADGGQGEDADEQRLADDIRDIITSGGGQIADALVYSKVLEKFIDENICGNLAVTRDTPTPKQHCITEKQNNASRPLGG